MVRLLLFYGLVVVLFINHHVHHQIVVGLWKNEKTKQTATGFFEFLMFTFYDRGLHGGRLKKCFLCKASKFPRLYRFFLILFFFFISCRDENFKFRIFTNQNKRSIHHLNMRTMK
jgi:hypothetical protein